MNFTNINTNSSVVNEVVKQVNVAIIHGDLVAEDIESLESNIQSMKDQYQRDGKEDIDIHYQSLYN